jgi:hypothetical protein
MCFLVASGRASAKGRRRANSACSGCRMEMGVVMVVECSTDGDHGLVSVSRAPEQVVEIVSFPQKAGPDDWSRVQASFSMNVIHLE